MEGTLLGQPFRARYDGRGGWRCWRWGVALHRVPPGVRLRPRRSSSRRGCPWRGRPAARLLAALAPPRRSRLADVRGGRGRRGRSRRWCDSGLPGEGPGGGGLARGGRGRGGRVPGPCAALRGPGGGARAAGGAGARAARGGRRPRPAPCLGARGARGGRHAGPGPHLARRPPSPGRPTCRSPWWRPEQATVEAGERWLRLLKRPPHRRTTSSPTSRRRRATVVEGAKLLQGPARRLHGRAARRCRRSRTSSTGATTSPTRRSPACIRSSSPRSTAPRSTGCSSRIDDVLDLADAAAERLGLYDIDQRAPRGARARRGARHAGREDAARRWAACGT